MFCKNCGNKIEEDAQFCVECGNKIKTETVEEVDVLEYSEKNTDTEIVKSHEEDKSLTKKIFSGIGVGGAVVGGGLLYLIFIVLRFLYIALSGLSMVWLAIILFQEGSIVWGLVALIIGTPIAIGIASFLFLPLLLFTVVALVIWGIISIFGLNTTFNDVWAWLWFIGKVFILGFMAYVGISEFVKAAKQKHLGNFLKETWFYIILFFFLLWIFF